MNGDWKKYSLEDVCERIYSGGTPSTRHSDYWNGELKWLSSGETSQRFIYDTERKITLKGVENSSTKLATRGCTVIATAGQGGSSGIIVGQTRSEAVGSETWRSFILRLGSGRFKSEHMR